MIFATPLDTPEGPVAMPDSGWMCVEMGKESGCVTRISQDGKNFKRIARTGRPNGLALDCCGFIWVAESLSPALLRMTQAGQYEVWLKECNGKPFIFPNDLAFGPDGLLYMTDSGIFTNQFAPNGQIRADYASMPYDGRVYQINLETKEIRIIDEGILFANGIVFGPGKNLYISETVTGNIYRYDWKEGKIGERQLFGNVNDPGGPPGWRGPDGMKFGTDGNLYCTVYNQGDVTVLDSRGNVAQRIKTRGLRPTNLAFGSKGERRIYVTEVEYGCMEALDVDVEGFPLYYGEGG